MFQKVFRGFVRNLRFSLLLCALFLAGVASANPVNINFSGDAVCAAPAADGLCDAQGIFTATFQFDPATASLVGAWSATSSELTGGFPFASSDGIGSVFFQVFRGDDVFDFSGESIDLQLIFSPANLQIPFAATVSVCISNVADCSVGKFISGVSPEPSSLLLLATGLLGLSPFLRRRRF